MTIGGGGLTLSTLVSLTSWVFLNMSVYLSRPQFPLLQDGDNHHHPANLIASGDKGCKSVLKNQVKNVKMLRSCYYM